MRRFLLHVLPSGFHRIRHYGLLANADRSNIATARELLHRPRQRLPLRPAIPAPIKAASDPPSCAGTAAPRCSSSRPSPGSVHPWAAQFTAAMIDIKPIAKTALSAFAPMMPSRTPMATFCKPLRCCHHHRLLHARCRCVLGTPPTHIDHAVPTIFASLPSTNVQIPIDPRPC